MMAHELELKLEAEKVIHHRFGYVEVYLKLNGEKSKYKLILRDGKLVAIVKRGYKLIPHELIDEVLRLSTPSLGITRKPRTKYATQVGTFNSLSRDHLRH